MGLVFDLIGGFVQAEGYRQQGEAANEAAQTEALQLDARGREEFAAAQREALAKRREGVLANSRIQALSAASGGGADDPTILKLMTGVAGDAEYGAQTVMFGGKQRRAGLFDAANNRRREGQASLLGSKYASAGAIFGGISSAASKLMSMS